MKKKRFWGIVSLCAILVGLIIVSLILVLYYTGHPGLKTVIQREEIDIENPITEIEIEATFSDVKIVTISEKAGSVRYGGPKAEKLYCERTYQDGKLTIKQVDARKWYEKIMINHQAEQECEIVLYLPQGVSYQSLKIKTSSGDVFVPHEGVVKKSHSISFNEVSVETSSGDIDFSAGLAITGVSYGGASFKTSSGDVRLQGVRNAPLRVETSTGDITLINSEFEGGLSLATSTGEVQLSHVTLAQSDSVYLKSDTGDISFHEVTAGSVKMESNSGDVELTSVLLTGELRIETDTGDVEIERSDAGSLWIETDTGDVEVELLTGKTYFVESDTGRVKHPPQDRDGGQCRVETDTGDVKITLFSDRHHDD